MAMNFGPHKHQIDVPVENPRPLIPSRLNDSRLGWGPRA